MSPKDCLPSKHPLYSESSATHQRLMSSQETITGQ